MRSFGVTFQLTRRQKKFIVLSADLLIVMISGFLANKIVSITSATPPAPLDLAFYFSILLFGFVQFILGGYNLIFKYFTIKELLLTWRNIALFGFLYVLAFIYTPIISDLTLNSICFQTMFLMVLLPLTRILFVFLSRGVKQTSVSKNIGIYGAGQLGSEIYLSLSSSPENNVVCFFDDNPSKVGAKMFSKTIFAPTSLEKVKRVKRLTDVVIAINNFEGSAAKREVKIFHENNLRIHQPSYPFDSMKRMRTSFQSDQLDYNHLFASGFEPISLDVKSIEGKVVLVTGAAGSIGQELARQLISKNPQRLIVLDNSEHNLFQLLRKLKRWINATEQKTDIVSCLASISDKARIKMIFEKYQPEIVFHSAAYKHVHIVEENAYEAIMNNVFGTENVASAALACRSKKFILVSSDKAVNSTNLMGASKRLAEIIVQKLAQKNPSETKFCVVRFGNVVGSSGSVVPIFEEQIKDGGPITVTDFKATRYFMTISDAVALVLLASEATRGGETYILDMGEPVRILDVARRMIEARGLTEITGRNPDGDIFIKEVGLFPEEKLHEELFNEKVSKSEMHPRLLVVRESQSDLFAYDKLFTELKNPFVLKSTARIRELLKQASILYM